MHRQFMLAALEQAWLGRGFCSPNPSVGVVVVCEKKIIASAYHHGAGLPHAEQLVLQQLGEKARGCTLYVTLEPCNHWGKTPPCVDAIQEADIAQVVYGFADPNVLVREGDTPRILEQAGIKVTHFPMPELDRFYQSYHHWVMTKKPWLTVKMAQSLDGKIAKEGGAPVRLSNDACYRFTHRQRLHADVILTTAKTIHHDNPRLDVRLEDVQCSKPLAILDRQLRVTAEQQVMKTGNPCYFFHADDRMRPYPLPIAHDCPTRTINNQLDLHHVCEQLGTLGFHDVWVEAGGRLFSALHQQGLVNRTYLYIVPKVLGETAFNGYHCDLGLSRAHQVSWLAQDDNMVMQIDWLEN